jgi:hypothetical protein
MKIKPMSECRGPAPVQAQVGLPEPAFSTERLNVFVVAAVPTAEHAWRLVYLAFTKDKDECGYPLVVATVFPNPVLGLFVEWVETMEFQRRSGFALELTLAIERHLGAELTSSGATPAGEALIAKREASRG